MVFALYAKTRTLSQEQLSHATGIHRKDIGGSERSPTVAVLPMRCGVESIKHEGSSISILGRTTDRTHAPGFKSLRRPAQFSSTCRSPG
jgi:hypothetical protein